MSMSTYVIGFRPPDENYKKKAAAWKACEDASVEIPQELSDFFDGLEPDPAGMEVDIQDATEEFGKEGLQGIQVDLTKLPKGLRFVRFVNSW